MAGDWIKIEENTPDKPEVHKMASILGIDPDAVVGKLVRVWSWASQNCNADGVTDVTVKALLNRITCVSNFDEAMSEVGWLAENENEIYFPNFDYHCSKTAKTRAKTNKRVSEHREVKRKCNGQSVTQAYQKALPEKRREEKSREEEYEKRILSSSSTNCDDAHSETPLLNRIMKTDIEEPEKPKANGYGPDARAVLHILNEIAGRSFRETDANLKLIKMRLKEPGVEVEGIRKMIKRQLDMWRGTEFERFLRPETLFNATKFSGYYDDREQPVKRGREAIRAQTEDVDWVAEGRSW
jgi:uncharacterized phage protein (TIGR02220 family)